MSFADEVQLVPGEGVRRRDIALAYRGEVVAYFVAVSGVDGGELLWPDGGLIVSLHRGSAVSRTMIVEAFMDALAAAPDWRPDYTIPEDYYAR